MAVVNIRIEDKADGNTDVRIASDVPFPQYMHEATDAQVMAFQLLADNEDFLWANLVAGQGGPNPEPKPTT